MKRLLSSDLPSTKVQVIGHPEEDFNHHNGDSNEAKKARLEKSPASRVVHLRNIDASELEIVQFGLAFGKISNVLNLRKKNQAFLQFDSVEHAQAMTDYFAATPILLNGRQIFVQFSNHQELKTDPNNANNQQAQAALQSATLLQEIGQAGGQNCVLRVIVNNMIYPIGVETFYQIFGKYGLVLKIITFTKNDKFQGLIQMKDAATAQSAKLSLNGQNIYHGCCTLQIDFSKLNSLNVKYNNDKSRDYTNPTLPSSENSTEPISIGARYLTSIPNVYGSPIVTLAGTPLTTLSTMNNNAIHFSAPTTTLLNTSQYATALACPMTNGTNPGATLLTTTNGTSLHHSANSSPYIFLSTSAPTSDEVCAHPTSITGKTTSLSPPSTFYFNPSTIYPTEFLRL